MEMKDLSGEKFTKFVNQSYKMFKMEHKGPILILYTAVPEQEIKLTCTFKYHAYL